MIARVLNAPDVLEVDVLSTMNQVTKSVVPY